MTINGALKLVPDLRLTLAPSNRCALVEAPRMNLGVGANAATRAEMSIVANDPLSELVWSPHKGLILTCVVGSVPEKKSSFSWGAGPGNMVLSPPHTIGTETNHGKLAEERIFIPPPKASKHIADEAAVLSSSLKSSAGNTPTCESGPGHESAGRRSNISPESIDHLLNARPVPGDFIDRKISGYLGENVNNGQPHRLSPIKGSSLQETHCLRKSEEASSQYKVHHQSNTFLKEDAENKMTDPGSSSALPLDKLESVAENDLQPSGKFVSGSALEIGNGLPGKEKFRLEVCEISKASPIRALASERKGKETAMSDGALKRGASQEDDNSYESSESCNSARMFYSGKKRVLSFEEQLIVGSKRLKMQIQETHASTSFSRSNSSFANWISTMIMGLPTSDEDGARSLAHPSDRNEKKELVTCSREQENKYGNMGFQSLFHSLYRPNLKMQDERLLCSDNYQINEGCKELKLTNASSEANDCPVLSNQDDLMALQQNIVSNETLSQPVLGASQDPLVRSTGLMGNVAYVPLGCKNDASSKKCNIDCFKDNKSVESQGHSSEEPTDSSFKKSHFPLDIEASCTIRKSEGQIFNKIFCSQRSKSSEPMVSLFAKRLDALKHIMQSDLVETTSSSTTCFFCGIIGHDLRCCSQVTETEVDELLRNITAYGGAEESPCLCIRCFQLNHWAVACPNAPSKKKHQLKDGVAHLHDSSSSAMWHQKRFERNLSLPDGIDAQTQVLRIKSGSASSPGYYKPSSVGTSLQLNLEMKESSASIRKFSSNIQSNNAASGEENASRVLGFHYQSRSLPRHILDIPTGIFEAVKSLQLSRTDIMKWMNSMLSTSLDGYYLRLRLGKLGEGLGGTSYHVACICGAQVGKLAETSRRPLSVVVGGIRCSVESQYISNQDFLEDELKAWWSAAVRGDGKIPSEDELRSKVEERRRLGL